MRYCVWRMETSAFLIHAVDSLGRIEICTSSQSPYSCCTR